MRLLFLVAVIAAFVVVFRLPETRASGLDVSEDDQAGLRTLLQSIEYAAITGKTGECGALSPLPLYAAAPSPEDWQALCGAVVTKDATLCGTISATIVPDLRAFCGAVFRAHS